MTEEKQIKKGFNKGYLLMKYGSDLAKKLEKGLAKDESPFSIGLKAGIKVAEQEKALSKIKSKKHNYDILKTKRSVLSKDKSKDRNKDLDKDK